MESRSWSKGEKVVTREGAIGTYVGPAASWGRHAIDFGRGDVRHLWPASFKAVGRADTNPDFYEPR